MPASKRREAQWQSFVENGGLFYWLTTSGKPCEKPLGGCSLRDGRQDVLDGWLRRGMPRTGWSACRGNCYCVLVPMITFGLLMAEQLGGAALPLTPGEPPARFDPSKPFGEQGDVMPAEMLAGLKELKLTGKTRKELDAVIAYLERARLDENEWLGALESVDRIVNPTARRRTPKKSPPKKPAPPKVPPPPPFDELMAKAKQQIHGHTRFAIESLVEAGDIDGVALRRAMVELLNGKPSKATLGALRDATAKLGREVWSELKSLADDYHAPAGKYPKLSALRRTKTGADVFWMMRMWVHGGKHLDMIRHPEQWFKPDGTLTAEAIRKAQQHGMGISMDRRKLRTTVYVTEDAGPYGQTARHAHEVDFETLKRYRRVSWLLAQQRIDLDTRGEATRPVGIQGVPLGGSAKGWHALQERTWTRIAKMFSAEGFDFVKGSLYRGGSIPPEAARLGVGDILENGGASSWSESAGMALQITEEAMNNPGGKTWGSERGKDWVPMLLRLVNPKRGASAKWINSQAKEYEWLVDQHFTITGRTDVHARSFNGKPVNDQTLEKPLSALTTGLNKKLAEGFMSYVGDAARRGSRIWFAKGGEDAGTLLGGKSKPNVATALDTSDIVEAMDSLAGVLMTHSFYPEHSSLPMTVRSELEVLAEELEDAIADVVDESDVGDAEAVLNGVAENAARLAPGHFGFNPGVPMGANGTVEELWALLNDDGRFGRYMDEKPVMVMFDVEQEDR